MITPMLAVTLLLVLFVSACDRASEPDPSMSFFVTCVPRGNGGNVGGLAGADAHCQKLAAAAGSAKREWRAYLSAAGDGDQQTVHARDRIGDGPWFNAEGVQIAGNIAELHGAANDLGSEGSLDERGEPVGFYHDMLTGSNADGTLAAGDVTCRNWSSTGGKAMVGHSNKQGSCCGDGARSWNSAHQSEGCSLGALQAMGGDGRFYCFATD
jgi:hypothetical protein